MDKVPLFGYSKGNDSFGDAKGNDSLDNRREFFFDYSSSISDIDVFHDTLPPQYYDDFFDVTSLCLPELSVNCAYHTSYDVTGDVCPSLAPCSSPKDLLATCMAPVDLLYPSIDSFLVIFDSDASLSISFEKSEFVGHICPFNNWLGGLANGLKI